MRLHLFTNNCHAHWNAIGEIRSRHKILSRDWSVQIMYTASVTDKQTNRLQYFAPASGRSNKRAYVLQSRLQIYSKMILIFLLVFNIFYYITRLRLRI